MTPQFLSTIIVGQTLGFTAYQPNLVARQFGLCQPTPKSMYPSYDVLVDITSDEEFEIIQEEVDQIWKERPQLTPTPYSPAFYCTEEFATWWQKYFNAFIGAPEVKLAELTSAFTFFKGKPTRGKSTNSFWNAQITSQFDFLTGLTNFHLFF